MVISLVTGDDRDVLSNPETSIALDLGPNDIGVECVDDASVSSQANAIAIGVVVLTAYVSDIVGTVGCVVGEQSILATRCAV